MTTYVQFVPSATQVFSFQAVLDGTAYDVRVTWNLFGARFYVDCYGQNQTLVFSRALVGSDVGVQIESASWLRGSVSMTAAEPHGYKPGTIVPLTISDMLPDAYNGRFNCLITGPRGFTYGLAADPGTAAAFGAASYDVSLCGGYFASTLVYRAPTRTFEIGP